MPETSHTFPVKKFSFCILSKHRCEPPTWYHLQRVMDLQLTVQVRPATRSQTASDPDSRAVTYLQARPFGQLELNSLAIESGLLLVKKIKVSRQHVQNLRLEFSQGLFTCSFENDEAVDKLRLRFSSTADLFRLRQLLEACGFGGRIGQDICSDISGISSISGVNCLATRSLNGVSDGSNGIIIGLSSKAGVKPPAAEASRLPFISVPHAAFIQYGRHVAPQGPLNVLILRYSRLVKNHQDTFLKMLSTQQGPKFTWQHLAALSGLTLFIGRTQDSEMQLVVSSPTVILESFPLANLKITCGLGIMSIKYNKDGRARRVQLRLAPEDLRSVLFYLEKLSFAVSHVIDGSGVPTASTKISSWVPVPQTTSAMASIRHGPSSDMDIIIPRSD